jgi:hypothetical protein
MIAFGSGADDDLRRLGHEPPHFRSVLGFSLDGQPWRHGGLKLTGEGGCCMVLCKGKAEIGNSGT